MCRWRLVLAPALGLLAAAGCVRVVGPARTADAYEGKAVTTAEAVLSALETARLTIDVADEGRAFAPYMSVSIAEAEGGAQGAQSAFESIQPPDGRSDQLREELVGLLDEATDTLAAARIAARRTDGDALNAEAEPIQQAIDQLDAFVAEHS